MNSTSSTLSRSTGICKCALAVVALTTTSDFAAAGETDSGAFQFRRHVINAESEFSACAAFDVNGDGRRDVVCGEWWYEAPNWKPRRTCNVERIRGRFADYSSLPLDVNGDGRLDLITANYRGEKIVWIEQPKDSSAAWTRHEFARPGRSETARLYDVDGDGRLDLLPNGTNFAAWWSLEPPGSPGSTHAPVWTRHPLPDEVAGHGVGFGDVDGDGRGDVVTSRGWFQAPQDRRKGRWMSRPEFKLHRDASMPILVFDVDRDGDNDVVWARGHGVGLYWFEQRQKKDAAKGEVKRDWIFHAIDTSIAQAHTLHLADLDNDGRPEVIAGKRYMGHEGRDVGEYDPLYVNAYSFNDEQSTWDRRVLTVGDGVGFDLDPAVEDVDGDGDVDLVCAGRAGLFLLENLLVNKQNGGDGREGAVASREIPAVEYGDHAELLTLNRPEGKQTAVDSLGDWGLRRAHVLANMQTVMGELPDPSRRVALDVKTTAVESSDKYERRNITFASDPEDRVPAWLLIPHGLKTPAPAMLCLHQTTKIGKDEPAGLGGRPTLHYAHELAERGYVCIVPDYPSFGEYPFDFKTQGGKYKSGTMKAVWNNVRALDVLESLPEVDRDRIGAIGHSLGGHNALFTAAFDQRIRATVSSCGFTAFHHYYGGKLAGWTSDRYMPLIRDAYKNDPDRVPFDFYEIVAALAPRAFFTNSPLHDGNFDAAGVKKIEERVKPIYELYAKGDGAKFVYPDSAHDFPDEIRKQAYQWLDRRLKR